ncbi:MAG: MgtC/SapB family protein [Candidatus Paceibacterota bacterium]|jgi:putative Mg2+ transporter-C (MgtC) family protein
MESLFFSNTDIFIRLAVAMSLGMLVGVERLLAQKTAGMRTYALVAMGSSLFVIISEMMIASRGDLIGLDPLRMASQIVVGVGFLGAGLIVFKDERVVGLTSASGLWVAAGIGVAAGFGLFWLSIMATILTLFIFTVLWFIEEYLKRFSRYKNNSTNNTDTL